MKKSNRTNARYTLEALKLLSGRIKTARITSDTTTTLLAERADISRDLLRRIENGDPSCAIGVVFEIAYLLGVPLFNNDISVIKERNTHIANQLTLLPTKVKAKKMEIDDDF